LEPAYDAVLLVGFGGPEKREDVLPFLENVLRGKNVPRERMLEVAAHYDHFDGVSPINAQMRALIARLRPELDRHGVNLPIFWGNRNWHPLLADTLHEMAAAGVRRAIAYVASAYSSYSGCRQYREDIERARAVAGERAPEVDKLRAFFNHPLFVAANIEGLQRALGELSPDIRSQVQITFTAHSIPLSMSRTCDYERQLLETCRLTAEGAGVSSWRWQLVFQSRSGRPEDPWLAPDILDHLRARHAAGVATTIVMPIGFLSDHMEVMYDLDYEARQVCDELGMKMVRAATVGAHPLFVQMIRELIAERLSGGPERAAIGNFPASHDVCPLDCCPAPIRPTRGKV
jgi:protoporphyrin/coproporphyrin ferrochelatase